MGEVEKTLERLNKALVKAGFPAVRPQSLCKDGDHWGQIVVIELRYDNGGKYITPEGGEY
jgi:hypothetical protein